MKVLHLCLANFYIDNYSYQENMLPKFHKKLGYDVEIIASLVSFDSNGNSCLLPNPSKYINEYGIPVTRLEYKNGKLAKRLRQYKGTYNAIENARADIIFIHGCQFLDIKYVVNYAKKNPNVKIYVDNHADFSNSARNFISKNILHKIIWKHCAHLIEPYTTKFYGVLPARVDFLRDIYKLPKNKIELLVMGADDDKVEEAKDPNIRKEIRAKHNISVNDILIVTGGKIDNAKKQTLLLMKAIKRLNRDNVKLLVFGSIINELKSAVKELVDDKNIIYIGWIHSEECYKYFSSADLAVFPGRHSVFWEQAAGLGVPMLVKYWPGTDHININGNTDFLTQDSIEEIVSKLTEILFTNKLSEMKNMANEVSNNFLYSSISKKSISE